MRSKSVTASFNYAIQGIIYALQSQRNMRIHFVLGLMVLVLATALNVTRMELVVLFLTVGIVITLEMLNTAIEEVVNLVTQDYHPIAKVAKNVAAGAVMVSSIMSLFVAYLIFIDRLVQFHPLVLRQDYSQPHLTVMALASVLVITVAIKARTGHKHFLRGGMPSGHAAVAFSIATAIFFAADGFAAFAGYFMALLVAQSRVEGDIHNVWEVLIGAMLGILVTVLFFQLKG